MVCAFGRGELACLEAAIRLGGHVRVGFENAIVDAEGNLATDNAERVALVADAVRRCGGEPRTAPKLKRFLESPDLPVQATPRLVSSDWAGASVNASNAMANRGRLPCRRTRYSESGEAAA